VGGGRAGGARATRHARWEGTRQRGGARRPPGRRRPPAAGRVRPSRAHKQAGGPRPLAPSPWAQAQRAAHGIEQGDDGQPEDPAQPRHGVGQRQHAGADDRGHQVQRSGQPRGCGGARGAGVGVGTARGARACGGGRGGGGAPDGRGRLRGCCGAGRSPGARPHSGPRAAARCRRRARRPCWAAAAEAALPQRWAQRRRRRRRRCPAPAPPPPATTLPAPRRLDPSCTARSRYGRSACGVTRGAQIDWERRGPFWRVRKRSNGCCRAWEHV
jgi:hypothetical protein